MVIYFSKNILFFLNIFFEDEKQSYIFGTKLGWENDSIFYFRQTVLLRKNFCIYIYIYTVLYINYIFYNGLFMKPHTSLKKYIYK